MRSLVITFSLLVLGVCAFAPRTYAKSVLLAPISVSEGEWSDVSDNRDATIPDRQPAIPLPVSSAPSELGASSGHVYQSFDIPWWVYGLIAFIGLAIVVAAAAYFGWPVIQGLLMIGGLIFAAYWIIQWISGR